MEEIVKKFEEFLEEAKKVQYDGKGQIVQYRFFDYFKQQYFKVRCEVLSYNEKTAKIKLLGFGLNGERPGTIKSKVHLGNLIGLKTEFPEPDIEYEEDEEDEPWWQK